MADLTITAANVVKVANAAFAYGTAGEAITQGQLICLLASDQKYYKADANDANKRDVRGIALSSCATNQAVTIQTSGSINPGASLTAGNEYYASATAGGLCPRADLTTGDSVIRVGYATTTSNLVIDIEVFGVVL